MNALDTIKKIESLLSDLREAYQEQGQPTPTPLPEPTPEPAPVTGPIFDLHGLVSRGLLVGNGALKLNLEYLSQGTEKRKIIAVWTTEFGSWEPCGGDYDLPQWARDNYLSKMPLSGGDHHMYALVLDRYGVPMPDVTIHYGSRDGQSVTKPTNARGFAEQEVYGSSSFVPERGEKGAWSYAPDNGEKIMGFGMPAKRHVSLFVVWKG